MGTIAGACARVRLNRTAPTKSSLSAATTDCRHLQYDLPPTNDVDRISRNSVSVFAVFSDWEMIICICYAHSSKLVYQLSKYR